jgi:dTDP-4-dehydrorhamnose 3,5-epimerase
MQVEWSEIDGVALLRFPKYEDERGTFKRLMESNLGSKDGHILQTSLAKNLKAGTIRGLHYQAFPSIEWKYLNCIQGKIFDVMVDIRPRSETYGDFAAIFLTEEDNLTLVLPPGIAHGYQTLVDNCIVIYHMNDEFQANLSMRLAYDDPTVGIKWPLAISSISKQDKDAMNWPAEY